MASGDEYGSTLEEVNIGGMRSLPWIIRRGAAAVRLTGAAPCHPQLVETRRVGTRLFACCLSAVHEHRGVPAAVSLSGISSSSASGSVSN